MIKKYFFSCDCCVFISILIATALLITACQKNHSIVWEREFCKGKSNSAAAKVIATAQGTFLLAYTGKPNATKSRSYVMEISESGDSIWSDSIQKGLIASIRQISDSGFIAAGQMEKDNSLEDSSLSGFLTRWLPTRKQLWTKTYLFNDGTWFSDVQPTTDGGYILCGLAQSHTFPTVGTLLVKTNANGDTLWTRVFNTAKYFETNFRVQQMPDGGYAVLGNIAQNKESPRNWNDLIIRTDAQGNKLWEYFYGNNLISKRFLVQDSGMVILSQKTLKSVSKQDSQYCTYIMRIDLKGDTLWTRRYSNGTSEFCATDIIPTSFGFAMSGIAVIYNNPHSSECPFLFGISSEGDSLWTVYYENIHKPSDQAFIAPTHEGNYLITTSARKEYNIIAIKTRPPILK